MTRIHPVEISRAVEDAVKDGGKHLGWSALAEKFVDAAKQFLEGRVARSDGGECALEHGCEHRRRPAFAGDVSHSQPQAVVRQADDVVVVAPHGVAGHGDGL